VPTKEKARIAELEREVKELRRAHAILREASVFFAKIWEETFACYGAEKVRRQLQRDGTSC
jgi:transposase-like protein